MWDNRWYLQCTRHELGISDHDLIFIIRRQKQPKPKVRTIDFRSLKNLNLQAFLSDLHKVPWDSSHVYDNIDDIWSHWSSLYDQVVDIHTSLKSIRQRSNQLPWINPNIQKQIRVRNHLQKKYRRFPTDENWCNYTIQRNVVTNLKR